MDLLSVQMLMVAFSCIGVCSRSLELTMFVTAISFSARSALRERALRSFILPKVTTAENVVKVVRCRVVRLFPDREYGFVRILGPSTHVEEAFFHFSVVKGGTSVVLRVGDELEVETIEHPGGKGLQVRKVLGETLICLSIGSSSRLWFDLSERSDLCNSATLP